MKKIICIGLVLILVVVGCGTDIGSTDPRDDVIYAATEDCRDVCISHSNWSYEHIDSAGWGRIVCYCKDADNAIWVFNI